ncbi:MAG TPA: F0F1 ATP synthase subunit A [Clostridium sp.]|uniref:ATP synthase subunit a n=1 Tax=Clostridium lapidicellarium TaxID=3240931 RepID=A0ABV4DVU4_9CLOT|nr:F0F1 ATP synthase subunit A [uncultured Clostridium sp.]HBC95607.1 F0F1 ATP synthase subunit A [Clostridium sp.]
MEELLPMVFSIRLFGYKFDITSSIFYQWIIIAVLTVLAIWATKDLKKVPDKKQTVVEMLVQTFNSLVKENMGKSYKNFVPYIGTLAIFLLTMNLLGLIGFKPPTLDISVVSAFALITFVIVQANAIQKIGVGHYFLAYFSPFVPMLPLNLLERIMLPVSLTLRLFGNMTASVVIVDLIYNKLGNVAFGLGQLVIPIPFHAYFDAFDGTIQMIIFMMLTMVNIRIVAEGAVD